MPTFGSLLGGSDNLYFAYGSNMDEKQMLRRCPDAKLVGVARLNGWRLKFAGYSRTWGGGVADLTPARGKHVDGVLYRVSDEDIERLDGYEGAAYFRREVDVTGLDCSPVTAQVYLRIAKNEPHTAPSSSYLKVISEAYSRFGFDTDALERSAAGRR